LLGQSQLWETLTNEYHAMLCELPMPHGGLFVWLESQLHEHGPVNWTALRAEVVGQAFETLALHLMSGPTAPSEHGEEAAQELHNVLLRLSVDRIDAEMKEIAPSVAEAAMGQRYRALDARRKALQLEISALNM
jgi:DNA primase